MQLQLAWRRASASAADARREPCTATVGLPQPLFSLSGGATSELAPDRDCRLACVSKTWWEEQDRLALHPGGLMLSLQIHVLQEHSVHQQVLQTCAWRTPFWWLLDLRLRLLRPIGALRMAVTACKARASAAGGAFAVLPRQRRSPKTLHVSSVVGGSSDICSNLVLSSG